MTLSSVYDAFAEQTNIKLKWKNSKLGNLEAQRLAQGLKKDSVNYTIIAPPPNLTGELHAGHAFEHYLMDTLARIARQKGLSTLYYPGVDHAGIQLEGVINKLVNNGEFDSVLEKEYSEVLKQPKEDKGNFLKKNKADLWLKLAWQKADEWRIKQREQAEILGETPDFDKLMFTLDDESKDMVDYAFRKYWEDGLIYKDSYLINWSVGLQTALSDVPEDIGRLEVNDPFIHYRYDLQSVLPIFPFSEPNNEFYEKYKPYIYDALSSLVIGTVRVETAIASKQLMAHSSAIRNLFLQKTNLELVEINQIIDVIINSHITIKYQIPVLGLREVILYIEDSLEEGFGTGIMKCTPAHDAIDYNLARMHGIYNFPMVINKQGKLTDVNGEYSQMDVYQARIKIIYQLLNAGYVSKTDHTLEGSLEDFNEEKFLSLKYRDGINYLKQFYSNYQVDWDYKHNVTICERSKTIVEPLVSEEFFLDYYKPFTHRPIRNFVANDWLETKLETENLILRVVDSTDSSSLQVSMSPLDADLVVSEVFKNEEEARDWIENRRIEANNHSRLALALINKQTSDFCGYVSIRSEDGVYKFSIWVVEKFRGLGLATEAMEGLMNWSFENLPTDKLHYEVKSYNANSIALAVKLGFVKKIGDEGEKTYDQTDKNGKISQQIYYVYVIQKPKTTLQKLTLDSIQEVKYYPEDYKERGQKYFEGIKNWCISRDLIWGHKMPIWYNLDLNPEKRFYSIKELKQNPELGKHLQISANKPNLPGEWVQEVKILDTWFSSTLWPLATLRYPNFIRNLKKNLVSNNSFFDFFVQNKEVEEIEYFSTNYPTQIMTSAWEIFYAWILRMQMTGKYFTGQVPFNDYLCHPWILDEKGKKMSKSLGNGFDPVEQINKYSSDTVRLVMLSGMIPGKNMRLGGSILDNSCIKYRNFGNKLWNIARFLATKKSEHKPISNLNSEYPELLAPASKWILREFTKLEEALSLNFYSYNLSQSIELLYEFVWNDLAAWYIEYLKTDESQVDFAFELLKQLIVILHPYLPFETEALWQELYPSERDLHYLIREEGWNNQYQIGLPDEFLVIKEMITKLRSIKGLFNIDPTQLIQVTTNNQIILNYTQYFKLLARIEILNQVIPDNYYQIKVGEFEVGIDLIGYVSDKNTEISRTVKQIESLNKQILGLENQLTNQKFIDNAETEIIEDKKNNLELRKQEKAEQESKLEILNG